MLIVQKEQLGFDHQEVTMPNVPEPEMVNILCVHHFVCSTCIAATAIEI